MLHVNKMKSILVVLKLINIKIYVYNISSINASTRFDSYS